MDQPEVIAFKTRTLVSLEAEPTADRCAVGIDLRDDWPAALRANFFDSSAPSAWIAEGLLVYLPPDAQFRLLDHVTALSAPGSRIATEQFADMSVFTDERTRAWRQRWRQAGLDIDVAELVWDGERNQVGEYLTSRGWRVSLYPSEEVYAANGFQLPDNEAVAELRVLSYLSAELT